MKDHNNHGVTNTIIQVEKHKSENDRQPFISNIESIGSAVLYGVCSTSMAFVNKAVVSTFSFDFPFFIMTCQMTLCIAFLETMRKFDISHIPKYTFKLGKLFVWPSAFYALHSITALTALKGMSIPMYAAVKRCAPIITLILSVVVLKKKVPSLRIILAVIFISVGCVIASVGDLEFDVKAYGYGAVSIFVQGLYLTLAQRSLENITALDLLYINSYNTIPFFLILCLLQEGQSVIQYKGFSDVCFIWCFALQAFMGVLLNYSLFLCTAKNSALTTSLVGVLKSVLQTFIGLFTFGGIKFTVLISLGLSINLFGGILYSYSKYKERIITNTIIKAI